MTALAKLRSADGPEHHLGDGALPDSPAPVRLGRPPRAHTSHLTVLGWLALADAGLLATTTLLEARPLGVALALSLLAALILAGWRSPRALASVRSTWTLPPPPHAGDETTLVTALSAAGGAPPLHVRAFSAMTRRFEIIARLPGLDGQPTRIQWSTRFPRRGMVSLPSVSVSTEQPFGLVISTRAVGDLADLLVLPALGRIRRDLRARIDQWLEAQTATTDPGDDEIARLRPYRPGDHPHRVHWKASARHRGLLVAERHAPGTRRLALVIDTASAGDFRRLERMICIAATLTDYLLSLGWSVSLHAGFAPHGLSGERARLFEALALAGACSDEVTTFIPPHRTVLILSFAPLPPQDLRPTPLALSLSECERLVRLPRRLR